MRSGKGCLRIAVTEYTLQYLAEDLMYGIYLKGIGNCSLTG